MPRFVVEVSLGTETVLVEADDETDALNKATEVLIAAASAVITDGTWSAREFEDAVNVRLWRVSRYRARRRGLLRACVWSEVRAVTFWWAVLVFYAAIMATAAYIRATWFR